MISWNKSRKDENKFNYIIFLSAIYMYIKFLNWQMAFRHNHWWVMRFLTMDIHTIIWRHQIWCPHSDFSWLWNYASLFVNIILHWLKSWCSVINKLSIIFIKIHVLAINLNIINNFISITGSSFCFEYMYYSIHNYRHNFFT